MALSDPITIRFPVEKLLLYQTEAAYRNQDLSVYLRERIEKNESTSLDIQKLAERLKESASSLSSLEKGVLIEILLLLRCIASPEKMLMVQSELKRLNYSVWQGESSAEMKEFET